MKQTGRREPSPWVYSRTAPIPVLEASAAMTVGRLGS